ncbi:MAG TPA: nucleotide disphospho-sugar-binding domain-containing protein [Spongiibacteraceae bacterium]
MAKILMTVPPLAGHINPALAVAAQLKARGHTVEWALHGALAGDKLPAGEKLYSLPAGDALNLAESSREVRGLESVRFFYDDFCLPLARGSLAPLEKIVRQCAPDLIFCDHQMLAGAMVARKLNIPWLTSITTSASILKMSPMLDDWIAEKFLELQTLYPLPALVERPDFSPYGAIVFSSEQLLGDKFERVPATYHFVGPAYSGRAAVCDFPWHRLDHNKKKILISLGTVSRDRSARFYEVMIAALADMDVQIVMVAPEEIAARAPHNFIVQTRVPQVELLPHMDAVICHAGHNTVCETLSFGLPLIVAPIRDDQPVIARQVIDAGAALFMRFGKVTAATARATVAQLLGDASLRRNAQRLAQSFQNLGGATQAVNIIEQQLQNNNYIGKAENARVFC